MFNLSGMFTALITPFTEYDKLDENGLRMLIQRQIEAKVDGIVFLGSTGETPTLDDNEKSRIMEIGREMCNEKIAFIVGSGSYSTKQTIENTLLAQQHGADAALVVTPYYNKPTQEGLYRHFSMIAEKTSIPLIIYDVPGRCGVNVQVDTLKRLMAIPSIIGLKETSGNVSKMCDAITAAKEIRPDFRILSGDDDLTLPLMALGGHGVISVISNLVPEEMVDLVRTIEAGDYKRAQKIHHELKPLMRAAFCETNPIPIKAAMTLSQLPSGECRLPLCSLSEENTRRLKAILHEYCSR
ncbi:MAG: 4-hydroxy-tetrahydrodipicolinate synthase [Parachlamydiaceae bacterium]